MKKHIALILTLALLLLSFASCELFKKADSNDPNNNPDKEAASTEPIKIAYMNGPTGMGIAKLIHDNGGTSGNEKYQFIKYDDAALATADLAAGNIDLACLPTNTAATLYNKTGKVSALAINCLNSLHIMTKTGVQINRLADLEGKTIYTIQNGTPAAILRHLLEESGVNATVETSLGGKLIAAPTDLAPLLITGQIEIALVPEPVATAAPLKIASQNKDYTYNVAITLTDVWSTISDSPVAMGCVVGNTNFVSANKDRINAFLTEYEASINYIADSANRDTAAQYIVDAGVLDAVPAAKKSLTNLGSAIAYIDGDEMKTVLGNFYTAIGADLIGGKLPDEKFYYEK